MNTSICLDQRASERSLSPAGPAPVRVVRWRRALVLFVVVSCLLLGAWGGSNTAAPQGLYQDFRDSRPLTNGLVLSGKDVGEHLTLESQGYRLMLPAGRKVKPPQLGVGVQATLHVDGDFQITGSYELLSGEIPSNPRDVVGVNLFLMRGPDSKRFGRLGRFNTQDGPVYEVRDADYTLPRKQTPVQLRRFPTQEKQGQLRLVREGTLLSYLVKDATTNGEFKKLLKADFGNGPLNVLLFEANPGEGAGAVDARLVDFRVHAGSPARELAETMAPPGRATESSASKLWLAIGLVLALALGAALALWQARRFSRIRNRSRPVQTAAPDSVFQPCSAPANLKASFTCAGCGKRIKARAELAGKKVKCPQCGAASVVPASMSE